MGWGGIKGNFFSFLFSQKLVHIIVISITIIIVFFNLTAKTKAGVLSDKAGDTIIAKLIKSEFENIKEEELIEEFISEEITSSPSQQNYLDNLTTIKSQLQAIIKSPDEIEKEENIPFMTQSGEAVIKQDIATTKKTKRPRAEIIYYIVQTGDTISTIAAEFNISVNTILWENNLSSYSLIRPGQKLTILPVTGITHKVARGENLSFISKQYNIEEEKIIEANNLTDAKMLAIGEKLIIPDGRKTIYAEYSSVSYTGLSAIKDLVIPPSTAPAASNKMNWPTVGHRITQYYSWRHFGVDIANKIGTPIYASDSGIIEYAGWSSGYGNNIVINHGGGKKTRYAHLSKFYIKNGDNISKGETIGAMGSTGWSTGSHLHFEVIINGRKYNPLNYIK